MCVMPKSTPTMISGTHSLKDIAIQLKDMDQAQASGQSESRFDGVLCVCIVPELYDTGYQPAVSSIGKAG